MRSRRRFRNAIDPWFQRRLDIKVMGVADHGSSMSLDKPLALLIDRGVNLTVSTIVLISLMSERSMPGFTVLFLKLDYVAKTFHLIFNIKNDNVA